MTTPTEHPAADLEGLRAKVLELEKMVQARKGELHREQEVKKGAEKKEAEDKCLKELFADGACFARHILKSNHEPYKVKILDFECECRTIEGYVVFLKIAPVDRAERIRGSIRHIQDTLNSIPGIGIVICKEPQTQRQIEDLVKDKNALEKELETLDARFFGAARAHMGGFVTTIFKSRTTDMNAILGAVKVAMVAGADAFREFGGRQEILGRLRTAVVGKIEARLTIGEDLDETEIQEVERILKAVQEAVGQQIVHK